MKRLLLMSILITATAAMSLQAELVITESTTRGGKNPQTDTLYAAPDKVAIVEPGTGGFIYLDKSKRLIEYSTTKGTYFEFTADTMKKLKAKTDKIIQDAKARMEKQLKSMPKDQQAAMQQAIDQMGQPQKYTYKKLGPRVTVGKWSCVPVDQYVDGEENQKLWVTSADAAGISAADTGIFDSLASFNGSMGGSPVGLSEPGLDRFVGFRAFVVKSVQPDADGDYVTTVTSIAHHAAPAGTYQVPSGLKKTPPPGL